mgnify:FL=1
MSGADLHVDELPVTAKINIPILNYHNVINEWYSVPHDLMSTVMPITNQYGSSYYALKSIDIDQCKLIGSVELIKPVVFNSQIPHRVVCQPGTIFPRVVLTCMFFKEPVDFLK